MSTKPPIKPPILTAGLLFRQFQPRFTVLAHGPCRRTVEGGHLKTHAWPRIMSIFSGGAMPPLAGATWYLYRRAAPAAVMDHLAGQRLEGKRMGIRTGKHFLDELRGRIGAGFFGGEGFILQRIEGDGQAFLHASGTLHEVKLSGGESLKVDTGCIVAMDESVDYDIQMVPGIKTALFGGEGLFFALLRGPGRVILQTMPFSRLADRIIAAAPRAGGTRREEGGVLGALGGLLDGDN